MNKREQESGQTESDYQMVLSERNKEMLQDSYDGVSTNQKQKIVDYFYKMTSILKKLESKAAFDEFINKQGLNLVHFSTSWAPSCPQMDEIIVELQREYPKVFDCASIDAEEVPEASYENGVTAAPTVIFFKSGECVDKLNGFHPTELRNLIVKYSFDIGAPAASTEDNSGLSSKAALEDRLKRLINKSRMTLFMKGNPDAPRCGFSRQIIQLLRDLNVDFWSFDILSDDEVREGLKEFSDWPTYPQLYLDGELLGGLDVVREELKDQTFVAKLPKNTN
uniref:Thioredoxin domain-containing protein n=1 Tax=Ditylenchus dipsaci TaxID=166011 RepID=A0A915D5V5_9BILA